MRHSHHASLPEPPANPWSLPATEVLDALAVRADFGLSDAEAGARHLRFGANQLYAVARRSLLSILIYQVRSMVMLLLMGAACLSFFFRDHMEAFAILAVIVINTLIGFVTEWRAVRSMEALRRLGRTVTLARRNGQAMGLPAEELVPGDIVLLEGGDMVSADMRVISASRLQADESTLTGESLPVAKDTEAVPAETPVMDRSNMLFKGSAVTRGSGCGVVTGTGMHTELGRISQLVAVAEKQATPLERRLNALAARLVWTVLLLALLIALSGVLVGRESFLAVQVAIALAVAAIPEGLPIVATIALARGMWRMARQNALISRLSAVETLGATSVILTDKTGTLTENRMTLTSVALADIAFSLRPGRHEGEVVVQVDGRHATAEELKRLDELLTMVVLCSSATVRIDASGDLVTLGDPTEVALLIAAAGRGQFRDALNDTMPALREESFDPQTKCMATYHRSTAGILVAAKGAPESLLEHCTAMRTATGDVALDADARSDWLERSRRYGEQGLRTLMIATGYVGDVAQAPYRDLVLLGIVGLEDPARRGVKAAIAACRDAGIRVVMVTGDHAATARRIAADLGLLDGAIRPGCFIDARDVPDVTDADLDTMELCVVSRATPEQKFALIDRFQQRGYVVAMTGDGVNDAPALRKADIGVAMGIRGTAVAKEAADMILQDDEFGTIVTAVAQGRVIYSNIRKFVVYLLSCNSSEILIVGVATVAGAPLPLLPLQLLFLNLVTDVFPALALGVGNSAEQVMRDRPRPAQEPMMTRRHWSLIGAYGLLMSATVLTAMTLAMRVLHYDTGEAVTVSFTTLALAQLWHVFNMRDRRSGVLRNEIVANGWVWAALALCLSLIVAAIYVPDLERLLTLSHPDGSGWLLILGMSSVPLLLGPMVRRAVRRFIR